MPRFFFHIRGAAQELSRDELGLNYPDVETAYRETFRAAQDIRTVLAASGGYPCDYTIDVVDTAHELVFRLSLADPLDHWVVPLTRRFRQ
jgi:hypothetical protein